MWTHCAVYIGDFLICEAVRNGIQLGSLLDYVPGYYLRFRGPVECEREDCWNVAVRALTRLRSPYDYSGFWQLFIALQRGAHRPTIRSSFINARSAICSQLYADAYAEAIGRILVPTTSSVAMPGDLSLAITMTDRMVRWADISRPRLDSPRSMLASSI